MSEIRGCVQFPCDVESDSFFAALATALLPALGYTEDTPFWCAPKGAYCVKCGACGDKTTLQKHHLSLYHAFLTATGVAFGFEYPEDDEVDYHSLPDVDFGWRWPDEFIDYVTRFAGLTWKRYRAGGDMAEVYRAISASLEAGLPTLARLGGEGDWQVITACIDGALLGLDSARRTLARSCQYKEDGRFIAKDWQGAFIDAIVITGKRPVSVSYAEVLGRIERALSHPSHARLESDISGMIDAASPENAQTTATILSYITGVPIEARWHAAEAMTSRENAIGRLSGDEALKGRLADAFFSSYIKDGNGETHGVCWKIWGILGFGPESGFTPPPNAGELLLKPGAKNELKRLFAIVFENDRTVLAALRAAAAEMER